MMKRNLAAVAFGVTMLATLGAGSPHAWLNERQTTYVTFGRSVSLPGVQLTPGAYIFELAAPGSGSGLVRVLSRDRRKVYTMQFTIGSQRPAGLADNRGITFDEAPAGEAPPIKAWYPVGEATGYAFIYRR